MDLTVTVGVFERLMFLLYRQRPVHTTGWIPRWSCVTRTRRNVFGAGLGVLLVSDTTHESFDVLVSNTLSIGRANVLVVPTGSCTYYGVDSQVVMCHLGTVERVW